jgi:hypothetical protein
VRQEDGPIAYSIAIEVRVRVGGVRFVEWLRL